MALMISLCLKTAAVFQKQDICTALESENNPNRKPEIGMALQAQKDFPEVDFHRSVMVGDSKSDELFAQRSRMRFLESIPALRFER